MENASKALIMIATVIIGMLIISLLVCIFTIFKNFEKDLIRQEEDTEIVKFNKQFLQYKEKEKNTIQDIITIANLASDINSKYQLTKPESNSLYVQVKIIFKDNSQLNNLEKFDSDYYLRLMDSYSLKDFECTEMKINSITKRVNYIEFREINEN